MSIKEKIEVMQAYAEGKKIQLKRIIDNDWRDWISHNEPKWNWEEDDYRIKPESKYRPYNDTAEMIEDFKRRFNAKVPPYAMPIIWVRNKVTGRQSLVNSFDIHAVVLLSLYYMKELFESFTYLDGSPCGMKEE